MFSLVREFSKRRSHGPQWGRLAIRCFSVLLCVRDSAAIWLGSAGQKWWKLLCSLQIESAEPDQTETKNGRTLRAERRNENILNACKFLHCKFIDSISLYSIQIVLQQQQRQRVKVEVAHAGTKSTADRTLFRVATWILYLFAIFPFTSHCCISVQCRVVW